MAVPDEQPLIRFKGVRKAFGPKVIYAGLELSVKKGEVTPSAAGPASVRASCSRC